MYTHVYTNAYIRGEYAFVCTYICKLTMYLASQVYTRVYLYAHVYSNVLMWIEVFNHLIVY